MAEEKRESPSLVVLPTDGGFEARRRQAKIVLVFLILLVIGLGIYQSYGSHAQSSATRQSGVSPTYSDFPSEEPPPGVSAPESPLPSFAVDAGSPVRTIALGEGFSCAIIDEGVSCWGSNSAGQLSNAFPLGQGSASPSPVRISLPNEAKALAAQSSRVCAATDGGVWCWGALGTGASVNPAHAGAMGIQAAPLRIPYDSPVEQIAMTQTSTCVLSEGQVRCWRVPPGEMYEDPTVRGELMTVSAISLPEAASAITAGRNHVCALVETDVWCWGANDSGQLGSAKASYSGEATQSGEVQSGEADQSVAASDEPVKVELGAAAHALAAGESHTCALTDGGPMCWGKNDRAQVGADSADTIVAPHLVSLDFSGTLSAIAASKDSSCVSGEQGVWCWGANDLGQLGNGSGGGQEATSSMPVPVSSLSGTVAELAGGGQRSCARTDEGLFCWGDNASGAAGERSGVAIAPFPVSVVGGA